MDILDAQIGVTQGGGPAAEVPEPNEPPVSPEPENPQADPDSEPPGTPDEGPEPDPMPDTEEAA